jgi:hypothetical protein
MDDEAVGWGLIASMDEGRQVRCSLVEDGCWLACRGLMVGRCSSLPVVIWCFVVAARRWSLVSLGGPCW